MVEMIFKRYAQVLCFSVCHLHVMEIASPILWKRIFVLKHWNRNKFEIGEQSIQICPVLAKGGFKAGQSNAKSVVFLCFWKRCLIVVNKPGDADDPAWLPTKTNSSLSPRAPLSERTWEKNTHVKCSTHEQIIPRQQCYPMFRAVVWEDVNAEYGDQWLHTNIYQRLLQHRYTLIMPTLRQRI